MSVDDARQDVGEIPSRVHNLTGHLGMADARLWISRQGVQPFQCFGHNPTLFLNARYNLGGCAPISRHCGVRVDGLQIKNSRASRDAACASRSCASFSSARIRASISSRVFSSALTFLSRFKCSLRSTTLTLSEADSASSGSIASRALARRPASPPLRRAFSWAARWIVPQSLRRTSTSLMAKGPAAAASQPPRRAKMRAMPSLPMSAQPRRE